MRHRYPPGVYGHCEGCGFYFHAGVPKTHLSGCVRETDPDRIRKHQLEQFGLALQRLIEPEAQAAKEK